jgi:hypothetical protein
VTNEVYAKPQAVSTYVMSATHLRAGASTVKSRSSRSAGRGVPAGAGTVVRGFFRPAAVPAMPISRISRPAVHRATVCSCHTFLAPYTLRPFLRSSHTRLISFFRYSSRSARANMTCSRFFAA